MRYTSVMIMRKHEIIENYVVSQARDMRVLRLKVPSSTVAAFFSTLDMIVSKDEAKF